MGKHFSAAEAARETGVSRTTITRMVKAGKFPDAVKTDDGWQIPLGDLLANGLTPGLYRAPVQPAHEHDDRGHDHSASVTDHGHERELEHQIELLRVQLEAAKSEAERASERAASAEAREVQANLRIDSLLETQRQLEAAQQRQINPPAPEGGRAVSRFFRSVGL